VVRSESNSSLWMMGVPSIPQRQLITINAAMERSAASEVAQTRDESRVATSRRFTRCEKYLLALFLLTLPLVNPWVHGDGVGYYALARSLLIEHRLDFQQDWLHANPEFRLSHTDENGVITPSNYTPTGHLSNHFAIGPAILWSPVLVLTHAGVLLCDAMGAHIPANGFSKPYIVSMAVATALYGFLALWISFQIARRYFAERWAFLGTVGIWFASSLPVYMYFNPSWSHAHSAFVVALFLWYWDRSRGPRTLPQWILLGLIAGLMMDVYYVGAIMLLLPFLESLAFYRRALPSGHIRESASLLLGNLLFIGAVLVAFLPTLITKKVIFGSYFDFGYTEHWYWNSPALLKVSFSAEHGLFSWTPIIVLAVLGLIFFIKRDRNFALYSLAAFAVYLYAIGCYQDWHGIASFGSRFFVSLTPLFVLGVAAFFDWLAHIWNERRARIVAAAATALFILWNFGMMYQWGTHLIPARGPISWRDAVYNQVAVVPGQAVRTLEKYILRRSQLMQRIENEDMKQLKSQPSR
jgi:hypothetical protein